METDSQNDVERIIADARALVEKVKRDLENYHQEFYRVHGVEFEKIVQASEVFMGPQQKEELNQLLEELEGEVKKSFPGKEPLSLKSGLRKSKKISI